MNPSKFADAFRAFLQPGEQRRRLIMTIVGVLVCGIGVAFFKEAAFGVDPFQCFCNGMDLAIPMIDFGTLYMLINLVLLIIVFFMNRHYIGIATFINLFVLGYFIDFCQHCLHALMGDPTMFVRVVYIIVGIVVLCISSSMYFTADLGVSTYDSIALHLATKLPVPFKFIRICTDLICVTVGFVLGYKPGVGTIITAFFMGPLISFFNVHMSEPMRYGKGGKPAQAK